MRARSCSKLQARAAPSAGDGRVSRTYNAWYRAAALDVDCVVWLGGSIHHDAARSFAIGFYGGLGEREPVAAAHKQGEVAISLEGLRHGDRPQLKVRDGVDAGRLILAMNAR